TSKLTPFVLRALAETPIFTSRGVKSVVDRTVENPLFLRIGAKYVDSFNVLAEAKSPNLRLGIFHDPRLLAQCLEGNELLTVACSPGALATTTIFEYLRAKVGVRIDLRTNFTDTFDIVDCIMDDRLNSGIDACVLASGSAARMLGLGKRANYRPLMPLP